MRAHVFEALTQMRLGDALIIILIDRKVSESKFAFPSNIPKQRAIPR